MNYKSACLFSWGLVLLTALGVAVILSSIDLSGIIYGMMGVQLMIEINFSPYANNVLDYVGRMDLETADGRYVLVQRDGVNITVIIDDVRYEKLSNVQASYVLNCNQAGIQ